MPIYQPDFTSVDANIPVFEGRGRVKITKRTAFIRESTDRETGDKYASPGVRYSLELVGMFDEDDELQTDDLAGKTVSPYSCYVRTDGGWKFAKPFLMAANGYSRKKEAEANAELFQKHSWIINGEIGQESENFEEIGDGWDQCLDRVVDVTFSKDVRTNEAGEVFENQDFDAWSPVD